MKLYTSQAYGKLCLLHSSSREIIFPGNIRCTGILISGELKVHRALGELKVAYSIIYYDELKNDYKSHFLILFDVYYLNYLLINL